MLTQAKKVLRSVKNRIFSNAQPSSTLEVKVRNRGERQAAPTLSGIRPDHIARYEFAATLIPEGARILDMASGVGYGSYILANSARTKSIVAVDLSQDAIQYAKQHYQSSKIDFRNDDCLKIQLEPEGFDFAVSFETIEHIDQDRELLKVLHKALKKGASLVLSTPNEDIMPHTKEGFPFHVRHYRKAELEKIIDEAGFEISQVHSQPDKRGAKIIPGWEGAFNIVVCKRR